MSESDFPALFARLITLLVPYAPSLNVIEGYGKSAFARIV